VQILYPNKEEQNSISEIILRIINNTSTREDKILIDKIILGLKEKGAEKIVLACTDLANIVEIDDSIIDTQKILIDSIYKLVD
jgi:aspartate/glutamate racemase